MTAEIQECGAAEPEITVWKWNQTGGWTPHKDIVAAEDPLEIRVDTHPVSITLRTPGHDAELALGFLLSEGLLTAPEQVLRILPYPRNPHGNVVDVQLRPDVRVDLGKLTRHVFTSSSCGLCGKATLDAVHQSFPPIAPPDTGPRDDEPGIEASQTAERLHRMDAETLLRLPEFMRQGQEAFEQTGGLHAAALFDLHGNPVLLREDVGRHNAVDKVLGWALQNGKLPLHDHVLLVSGRVSFEIVQKALAARLPILAAVSAPSSLAVALAQASHQTLVGFLRPGRFNVYSCPERIR